MTIQLRGGLRVDEDEIADFCQRWRVRELAVFGSALRDDFGPASDVDVLVVLDPDAHHGYFDLIRMREELAGLFGRDVDLVERDGLVNPIRRRSILSQRQLLYAA